MTRIKLADTLYNVDIEAQQKITVFRQADRIKL
jgi:hypothetical protein